MALSGLLMMDLSIHEITALNVVDIPWRVKNI